MCVCVFECVLCTLRGGGTRELWVVYKIVNKFFTKRFPKSTALCGIRGSGVCHEKGLKQVDGAFGSSGGGGGGVERSLGTWQWLNRNYQGGCPGRANCNHTIMPTFHPMTLAPRHNTERGCPPAPPSHSPHTPHSHASEPTNTHTCDVYLQFVILVLIQYITCKGKSKRDISR